MHFIKQFTFPTKHEPKHKSFEWIIREDKVLFESEINNLREFCKKLKKKGIKLGKFFLIRNWFVVELGLLTGLRVEEMTDLQIRDILIDNDHASVFVRNGKGGKRRIVWINNEFKQTCLEFLKIKKQIGLNNNKDNFLLTTQKGKKLTKRALQKQFKICINLANLPSRYSIHCLRHTYATFLLRVSRSLKLVKEQLGHSSIKTTEVYIALIVEDRNKALSNLYKTQKRK